ncbi:MAG: EAL domain-containing protein [Aestuariibacter sp.]
MNNIFRMYKSRLCLLITFVGMLWASGNIAAVVDTDNVRSATLQRLSVDDGLSQGSIVDVYQDNQGYIWVATSEGLNFYNGYEVRQFRGPNDEFLAAFINFVYQDKDGYIWISVFDFGLYRYAPQSDELSLVFATDDDAAGEVFSYLAAPQKQQIWFLTTHGLLEYDMVHRTFTSRLDLSESFGEERFFTSITETDDTFFLGSNQGLVTVSKTYFTHTDWQILSQSEETTDAFKQRIRKLLIVDDALWIATARGLLQAPVAQFNSTINQDIVVANPIISSLAFEDLILHQQNVYAASQQGLFQIEPDMEYATLLLQFSMSNQEVFNNRIRDIMVDRSGNFWLASVSRGLYIWNPRTRVFNNRFNTGGQREVLSDNVVWSIAESESGELWIGTSNGLTRISAAGDSHKIYFQSDVGLEDISHIEQVAFDPEGYLWLSTWAGIIKFDTNAEKQVPIATVQHELLDVFKDEQAYFKFDRSGRMWLVTLGSYYLFEPDSGDITELVELRDKANPYFSFGFMGQMGESDWMLMSGSGQLWGVHSQTLEVKLLYELDNYSPQEFIYIDNFVFDEERQLLWLSFTSRGIMALSLQDFTTVYVHNEKSLEPISPVYGLVPDENGRLWFSSHDGIYSLNMESKHVSKFDTEYGLSVMEFNSGAYNKLSTGELIYGSVKGLTRFYPEHIGRKADFHRQVYIDEVSIDGVSQISSFANLAGQSFSILNDHLSIQVSFTTLGFEQQNKVRYEYQLIQDEIITYPVSKKNTINFTRLLPGHYELRVNAISPKTGFRTKPSSIFFEVKYTAWLSPGAKSVYVTVLVLLIVFLVFRRKQKRLAMMAMNRHLELSEERLQIALRSSHSYAWEWNDSTNNLHLSKNSEDASQVTPETFKEHYQEIHPDDRRSFLKEWQRMFDSADIDAFNFTYRMKSPQGEFRWYRNVGRILQRNEHGKPQRISGLFTDITEIKSMEESASIFGEAFRNTKDWVVIIDAEFNGVMANNSFYKAFNVKPNSTFSLNDEMFAGLTNKMLFYRKIMGNMNVGEHWHGEDSVKVPDGTIFHVLINISLIKVESHAEHHFVVIFTDITKQKEAEDELRKMANYDPLTSLPNRTLLIDRIEHAIQGADRNNDTLALLFLDLDRFKPVNDSLGHEYGDMLLQKIAQRLKSRVRRQDTVARLGGDEFVVVLESFKDVTHVGEVAQEIAEHIGKPVQLGRHRVSVAPSIGIALYPSDARTPSDLLRDADIAMYHAKKDPSHCFHFYTDSMDLEVRETLQKEYNLKQAQVNQEFINYYQPIIDARTGHISGAELLLRWRTLDGIIAPKEFIPLSEQIGLIIPMTNDALSRGLLEIKAWREKIPDFYLSLNLSVIHFEQENIVDSMAELLQQHGLPPSALRVEVTESALMSQPDKAITTMRRFMEKGIMLALDDFGTGYSSFAYLKKLPLNAVKLDRSFIWGIGHDEKDEIIVDAILAVAESMDLFCVAEGVETVAHLEYLEQRGCQYLQGYYFAKPLGSDDFTTYLDNFKPHDKSATASSGNTNNIDA